MHTFYFSLGLGSALSGRRGSNFVSFAEYCSVMSVPLNVQTIRQRHAYFVKFISYQKNIRENGYFVFYKFYA